MEMTERVTQDSGRDLARALACPSSEDIRTRMRVQCSLEANHSEGNYSPAETHLLTVKMRPLDAKPGTKCLSDLLRDFPSYFEKIR